METLSHNCREVNHIRVFRIQTQIIGQIFDHFVADDIEDTRRRVSLKS